MYADQNRMHRDRSWQQAFPRALLPAAAAEAVGSVESEMQHLFAALFEQSGIGKCLFDAQGNVLNVNETLSELLGYRRAELQQSSVSDWFPKSEQTFLTTILAQLISGQLENFQTEKQLLQQDGSLVWARLHFLRLLELERGQPSLLLEVQDLSIEQETEQASDSELERLRQAGDLAKVSYAILDLQSGEVYWSQELYQMLGITPETQPMLKLEQVLKQYVYLDDQARLQEIIADLISSAGGSRTLRMRIVRGDGQLRLVQAQVELLTDQDKQPLNLIAYHLDLTPYLETSLQIQLAHQHLSEKSRQLQQLSELVDDRLTSPLSGLQAVATHYSATELKVASLVSQVQLDWISQDLKDVRSLPEESLPVSLEHCCQRALQMLEVETQIREVSFGLDFSAWSLIEYVPFYLEHLLYQLFRESLLLLPPTLQGGQRKINLRSLFDETGRYLLDFECEGSELYQALNQPDAPLGQLRTLIEARGGKLECRASHKQAKQKPSNQDLSHCRIWL